jgi:hypothetical protein
MLRPVARAAVRWVPSDIPMLSKPYRQMEHPFGLLEGVTENAAVVRALLDNLIDRGLDPKLCRLFIVDGSKALIAAIRRTFGRHTPIQRCQVHKARNSMDRLPRPLHAPVRTALRQAWELDDAAKAERLLRNLARRLEQVTPGVPASILEGLDEMLTVIRLGLPPSLRRPLACTNIIENMMGTVRRVCRNVNAGATPPWPCVGQRLRCRRLPKASGDCRHVGSSRTLASPEMLPSRRTCAAPFGSLVRGACIGSHPPNRFTLAGRVLSR